MPAWGRGGTGFDSVESGFFVGFTTVMNESAKLYFGSAKKHHVMPAQAGIHPPGYGQAYVIRPK